MTRHRRRCEGSYHLSCELCGQRFHRRDRYNTHLQLKHRVMAPPIYMTGRGSARPLVVVPEELAVEEQEQEGQGQGQG